ncbi:hypothetical protein ACHAWU_006880 [Discostella pseudostelligera]|uniref:Serine/threonine-protein phosphatase PGAM5, mitochondrial n=1 Tax=Discostella pseudostelligera TaxID=259834 RepID=A0ABD3MZJ4_9STRA
MAQFFSRVAGRHYLSSTIAAATATTLLATSISPKNDSVEDDVRTVGSVDGSRHRVEPSRRHLHLNSPQTSSSLFAYPRKSIVLCEAQHPSLHPNVTYKPSDPAEPGANPVGGIDVTTSDGRKVHVESGMWGEEQEGSYHGLFPRRQLWRPTLEYPLWENNWDGRQLPPITSLAEEGVENGMTDAQRERYIRKKGVTRHIILIRHGQYDETYKEDDKRILTPLGRQQAELTGKRLGKLIRGVNEQFGPCRVKVIRVSNLARAKETADIIYENMGASDMNGEVLVRADPDPCLNEGRPCHHIPGGKVRPSVVEITDEQHPRIERAFRKYFYRADMPDFPTPDDEDENGRDDSAINQSDTETQQQLESDPQHEFEIIVCHANVIRYFFCRALQLPPEAWLRLCTFNCSLTYFTIRPTGTVSCRMLGDIGHLPYELNTFSGHTGFNW